MLNKKVVELHDRSLVASIEQFLNQKKQKNKNTYKSYCSDIQNFFEVVFGKEYKYVNEDEFNSEKTNLDGIIRYFDYLYELKDENGEKLYANSTINRKQASIKALLKFLKIKKVYHYDLSELELVTNLPNETDNIEVLDFSRSMEYANWIKENERFKKDEKFLIIMLAIDTGLRATELLSLEWNQFKVEEDSVLMSGYGKRNKKWIERISLPFYNELLKIKGESSKVFSLTYTTICKMMKRARVSLGDGDRDITFHSFKKCAVNSVFMLTGDILEAQRKGRHESLDTTRIYLQGQEYGITGIISLGDKVDNELYKKVENEVLCSAIELMNKDFQFILNNKISEVLKKRN